MSPARGEELREKKGARKGSVFAGWMPHILATLRNMGGIGSPQEVSDTVAKTCKVPDSTLEEVSKGGVPKFYNQVAWARQYLVWEGLLASGKRGLWELTEKGWKTVLTPDESQAIVRKWVTIHTKRRKANSAGVAPAAVEPESEPIIPEVRERTELLAVLRSLSPSGFEQFCKYLLKSYGFENVETTPIGKDGGIDGYGVLQLNPLVSFKVVFQCKRYSGTVSRSQVGDLRNAMLGRADKGILLTTGTFSEDAKREAVRAGAPPVELVDGTRLVEMLRSEEIGVIKRTVYDVDYEFFQQYQAEREEQE